VSTLDAHDVLRLLLLETAVWHLTAAGVIDEDRVLDGLVAELTADLDAVITDEETDAGRRAQVAQQLEHARRRRQDVERERERRAAAREALARARATALEDAYRCLSALRRLELETA